MIHDSDEYNLGYRNGLMKCGEDAEELRQYRALGSSPDQLRYMFNVSESGEINLDDIEIPLDKCPVCERDFGKSSDLPSNPAEIEDRREP